MEPIADVEDIRNRAVDFIENLFRNATSPRAAAQSVCDLALENDNPVRALFAAARPLPPPRPVSPTETIRPRTAHRLLSFGRHRDKSRAGKSDSKATKISNDTVTDIVQQRMVQTNLLYEHETFAYNKSQKKTQDKKSNQKIPPPPLSKVDDTANRQPVSSWFPTSEANHSSSTIGVPHFNCIVCQEDLSSKGVCRRHLEEQHVAPKAYQCEKCGPRVRFKTKAEAKKHCQPCGEGIFTYIAVRPEARKLYACEYTGNTFPSLPKYLDHLLELCQRIGHRPTRSLHRKVRALLGQPMLRQPLEEISTKTYGPADAWRKIRWEDRDLHALILELEHAVVHENGNITFDTPGLGDRKTRKALDYLTDRLAAGHAEIQPEEPTARSFKIEPQDTEFSSGVTPQMSGLSTDASMTASPMPVETPAAYHERNWSRTPAVPSVDMMDSSMTGPQFLGNETRSKRPLSDQSRLAIPDRNPPGPPVLPDDWSYQLTPGYLSNHQEHHMQPQRTVVTIPERPVEEMMAVSEPQMTQDQSHQFQYNQTPEQVQQPMTHDNANVFGNSYQSSGMLSLAPFDSFWSTQHQHNNDTYMPTYQNVTNPHLNNLRFGQTSDRDSTRTTSSATLYSYPQSSIDASSRTTSVITDDTYLGSFSDDQKLADYMHGTLQPSNFSGTFYIEGEDRQNDHNRH